MTSKYISVIAFNETSWTTRKIAMSLGLVALVSLGGSSTLAHAKDPAIVGSGPAWEQVKVAPGGAQRQVILVHDESAIRNLPLSASARSFLAQGLSARDDLRQGGALVVDLQAVAAIEAHAKATGAWPRFLGFPKCPEKKKTKVQTINITKPIDFTKSSTGGLSGSVGLKGQIKVNGTMSAHLTFNKGIWIGKCIYPSVVVSGLDIDATTDSSLTAAVDGKFQRSWSQVFFEKDIEVVDQTIMIAGVFPLRVLGYIPLKIGLDADAAATLEASSNVKLTGRMKYQCKLASGCSGTRSFNLTNSEEGSRVNFEVNTRAKVTPYADVGVRISLYSDKLIYAQASGRVNLTGDLWGYVGNTCGDADADGQNEVVKALTLNLGLGVDARVSAGFGGKERWKKEWKNVYTRNLGFWALGGSTALTPIFDAEHTSGRTVLSTLKMRPCWPYADKMSYVVNWGDGTSSTVSGSPNAATHATHTFGSRGAKSLEATATRDAKSRSINQQSRANVVISGSGSSGDDGNEGNDGNFDSVVCKKRPGHPPPPKSCYIENQGG